MHYVGRKSLHRNLTSRYNNFHVNALCSPTRASLLTGRNNHQVGFGSVSDNVSGGVMLAPVPLMQRAVGR